MSRVEAGRKAGLDGEVPVVVVATLFALACCALNCSTSCKHQQTSFRAEVDIWTQAKFVGNAELSDFVSDLCSGKVLRLASHSTVKTHGHSKLTLHSINGV